MTFLDWEKAFDRVRQDKMIEALERMQVDKTLIELVSALYNNPTFAVKIEGKQSDFYRQARGIRQGCPLSPYLFLTVMAVMFDDIHLDCDREISWARMKGVSFSEVLYADDTALVTDEPKAMNKLLQTIEKHAKYYGLNFNKAKCEAIKINANNKLKFTDGTELKGVKEVIYLGCSINNSADTKKEIQRRMTNCIVTMKRLHLFWKESDTPKRIKLQIYDAIIRSKLVYG